MSKIDQVITTKVSNFFGTDSISFTSFSFGENSKAYSFSVKNHQYVLRVSLSDQGFVIDRIISNLITNSSVPTPETLLIGKNRKKHFSVTQRVPGTLLIDEDDNTQLSLMSEFLKVSFSLHTYSREGGMYGYGPINEQGHGKYPSWESFIRDQTQYPSGIWSDDYFEILNNLKMLNYVYVPEVNGLIHGDYGYKNVIVDNGKITGIIDWEDAMYGDFIYDIAYIHFWASQTDFQKIFFKHYSTSGKVNMSQFKKRFDCYTLYIGISLLNYFASKKDSKSFNWIKQKTDQFVAQNNLDCQ